MTVRPLDLLDLPFLSRYRRDVLTLDSARALTRGNPLGAVALLSYLNPRRHIHTALASGNGDTLMGQVILTESETSARLTFLAPQNGSEGLTVSLVEALAGQAGEWGAFHLLAEVEEHALAFRSLHQAGFSMYAWQRVWKLAASKAARADQAWRPAEDGDWPAVQSLHDQIVPALLQPFETLPKRVEGLVCRPTGDLQAHITVSRGPAGIWVQPLIHPDSECTPERLAGLAHAISAGRGRPLYFCVRSYQAWLESVLDDLGAEAGPRQAVMVKRLAKLLKAEQPVKSMEKVLAKPAAPVARAVAGEDIRPKNDIKIL